MGRVLPIKIGSVYEPITYSTAGEIGGTTELYENHPMTVPVKIKGIHIVANDVTASFAVQVSMMKPGATPGTIMLKDGTSTAGVFSNRDEFIIPAGWFLSILTNGMLAGVPPGGKLTFTGKIVRSDES